MNPIPRRSLLDKIDFFNDAYSPLLSLHSQEAFSPRVDVTEKDDSYEIVADLPGVDKKDMSVTLEDGVLKIEASSHRESNEAEDGQVIRKERYTGKYLRSFSLGSDIHGDDIQADFKDGVLILKIPKSRQVPNQRKVIDVS